ncbi:phosphatidylinositol 4,5-bisphosphate-binding protein [Savitreella phatthalungensis]
MTDSILSTDLPYAADPIAPVQDRFSAWQGVIDQLITYFDSLSKAEAQHNKELVKVSEAIPEPFSTHPHFDRRNSGGSSVDGVGQLLKQEMRGRLIHSDQILRTLNEQIIPHLTESRKSLNSRIKDISGMSGDFQNSLSDDLPRSKAAIINLQSAIADWESNSGKVDVAKDPFLVDLDTRKILRKQLAEEQYLRGSLTNLQRSAQFLEQEVVTVVRRALQQYNELVSREAAELAGMSHTIDQGIEHGQLNSEWQLFAQQQTRDGLFLAPTSQARALESQTYAGKNHPSTTPVFDAWLERKSGRLSGYSTAFYIVTPSRFLHEFKSNDLRTDSEPTFSLYLPDCSIVSVSKDSDKSHKLILRGKQTGGIHQSHDWTFRAKNRADVVSFYTMIGRAADLTFTMSRASVGAAAVGVPASTHEASFVEDADDNVPFRGPETLPSNQTAVAREPAGQVPALAYASPLAAARVVLDESAPSGDVSNRDGVPRKATSTYGDTNVALAHAGIVNAPATDAAAPAGRQSSGSGFISERILDDNSDLPYDREHGTASTLPKDKGFIPVHYDAGRRSSLADIKVAPKRQSSLAFRPIEAMSPTGTDNAAAVSNQGSKPPSRKATVSYGEPIHSVPAAVTSTAEETSEQAVDNRDVSPWFPRPGEGTSGRISGSTATPVTAVAQTGPQVATIRKPSLASEQALHQYHKESLARGPTRKMSLSEQILAGPGLAAQDSRHQEFEPLGDASPQDGHAAAARYRVSQPPSRQASIDVIADQSLAAHDAAPHMRIGTQTKEDRYKVGSRRGSRSNSGVATPLEGALGGSSLETTSTEAIAARLAQSSGKPRRTPSRSGSLDLGDGSAATGTAGASSGNASPGFKINEARTFRKPPSRGSSLSMGGPTGQTADGNVLTSISEAFERDLAAAKGNQAGDTHIPGEFPRTNSSV